MLAGCHLILCVIPCRQSPCARRKSSDLCWAHLQELLGSLSNVLETLRGEGAPPPACRAVVHAALRYVDAELLNALMLRRDCCSISAVKALQVSLSYCHHCQISNLSMQFDPSPHTISGFAPISACFVTPVSTFHQDRLCPRLWHERFHVLTSRVRTLLKLCNTDCIINDVIHLCRYFLLAD